MLTYRKTHEQQPNLRRLAALLRVGFFALLMILIGLLIVPQQPAAAQTAGTCQINTTWQLYTVVSGDTLAKIARRFNSSINALIIANCLTDPNRILVGQQLRVPPGNPGGGSQVVVGATYMQFERGFMIWRGDLGTITVYYGTGMPDYYETFPIWSYAFLPENPQTAPPPANHFKPAFGFGKIWGNNTSVRNALGWGKTPEQGFAAVYISNPPELSVNLPNNRRISMLNNAWKYIDETPPVTTYNVGASYQPFERGFMIWFSNNNQIYAFTGATPGDGPNGGSGTFTSFTSESYGNLPQNPMTETPPFNRYHPKFGFGKVWWNFPTTRSKLGWAMQPEYGYDANLRFENGVLTSLTVPDGRSISLAGGGWGMPKFTGDKVENSNPVPQASGVIYANLIETRPDNVIVHVEWEVTAGDAAVLEIYDSETATTPINVFDALPVAGETDISLPAYTASQRVKFVIKGVNSTTTLATQELVFPVIAPPQPTPTPIVRDSEIHYFAVDPIGFTPETFTLNVVWNVSGVDSVQIQWRDNVGDATPNESFTRLPLTGTLQIKVPAATAVNGDLSVVLLGWRGNTVILQDELFVRVQPPPPVMTMQAAYQPYQGGFALWLAGSGEILTFYSGTGRFEAWEQTTYEVLPDNPVTDTPPSGLIMPVSGFGKVWGNYDAVRQGLGWATQAEQGYTLEITTEPDPSGSMRYIYSLPDGRKAVTINGNWNYSN